MHALRSNSTCEYVKYTILLKTHTCTCNVTFLVKKIAISYFKTNVTCSLNDVKV